AGAGDPAHADDLCEFRNAISAVGHVFVLVEPNDATNLDKLFWRDGVPLPHTVFSVKQDESSCFRVPCVRLTIVIIRRNRDGLLAKEELWIKSANLHFEFHVLRSFWNWHASCRGLGRGWGFRIRGLDGAVERLRERQGQARRKRLP